ncbi:MAG: hypothetical protein WEA09_08855 [Gemmatimonadota bacterium]
MTKEREERKGTEAGEESRERWSVQRKRKVVLQPLRGEVLVELMEFFHRVVTNPSSG